MRRRLLPALLCFLLPLLPNTDAKGCDLDIMFVMDSSSSVRRTFEKQVQFVLELADMLTIGPGAQRAALLEYSGPSKIVRTFDFDFFDSTDDFKSTVANLRHFSGITHTQRALSHAKNVLEGRRTEFETLVIVVTDGYASDNPEVIAPEIRKMDNIHVFAVGLDERVNFDALVDLTGDPHRVFVEPTALLDARALLEAYLPCDRIPFKPVPNNRRRPDGPGSPEIDFNIDNDSSDEIRKIIPDDDTSKPRRRYPGKPDESKPTRSPRRRQPRPSTQRRNPGNSRGRSTTRSPRREQPNPLPRRPLPLKLRRPTSRAKTEDEKKPNGGKPSDRKRPSPNRRRKPPTKPRGATPKRPRRPTSGRPSGNGDRGGRDLSAMDLTILMDSSPTQPLVFYKSQDIVRAIVEEVNDAKLEPRISVIDYGIRNAGPIVPLDQYPSGLTELIEEFQFQKGRPACISEGLLFIQPSPSASRKVIVILTNGHWCSEEGAAARELAADGHELYVVRIDNASGSLSPSGAQLRDYGISSKDTFTECSLPDLLSQITRPKL